MTVVELGAVHHREEGGVDYYTVRIADYKTGKSERVKIVYEKDLHSLLQRWMKVREAIIPPECPFVFPNLWRCRLTDLTKMVSALPPRPALTFQHPGLCGGESDVPSTISKTSHYTTPLAQQ